MQWNCLRLSLKIKKQIIMVIILNFPDVEQFATGVRPIDCVCSFLFLEFDPYETEIATLVTERVHDSTMMCVNSSLPRLCYLF